MAKTQTNGTNFSVVNAAAVEQRIRRANRDISLLINYYRASPRRRATSVVTVIWQVGTVLSTCAEQTRRAPRRIKQLVDADTDLASIPGLWYLCCASMAWNIEQIRGLTKKIVAGLGRLDAG